MRGKMFKKIFVDLCNQRDESPSAVCMKLGFSNSTFSQWKDDTIPRDTTLAKFADYFGVSIEYLKGKEEKSKNAPPKKQEVEIETKKEDDKEELYNTNYSVYRIEIENDEYYNFECRTTYSITLNGETIKQNICYSPPKKNTSDYNLLTALLKENIKPTLKIKIEDNKYKTIIDTQDDHGIKITYTLQVSERSKIQFDNFIALLKHHNIIPK